MLLPSPGAELIVLNTIIQTKDLHCVTCLILMLCLIMMLCNLKLVARMPCLVTPCVIADMGVIDLLHVPVCKLARSHAVSGSLYMI